MEKLRKTGFTLIELLIVIAIILILIAIALPNFLEAQERARVTRANGHLKTMETAINAHIVDYGGLYSDFNDPGLITRITRNKRRDFVPIPCPLGAGGIFGRGGLQFIVDQRTFYAPQVHCPLTTPIKYLDAKVTINPWSDGTVPVGMDSRFVGLESCENPDCIFYSVYFTSGPDRVEGDWVRGRNPNNARDPGCFHPDNGFHVGCPYSPTNGTKSRGDLWFVIGPDTKFARGEFVPLRTF